MLSFLLKKILRRGLAITIGWSIAYPTITGNIGIRNISLGAPPILTAEHASVNLGWTSLFGDEIVIDHATVDGLRGEIELDNPLRALYCLKNKSCSPPAKTTSARARLAGAAAGSAAAEPSSETKNLSLTITQFELENGEIVLLRGETRVLITELAFKSKDLHIPLKNNVRLGFSFRLAPHPEPVKGILSWNESTRTLGAKFTLQNFPLSSLSELFPNAFGSSVLSGKISGPFELSFREGNTAGNDGSPSWKLESGEFGKSLFHFRALNH